MAAAAPCFMFHVLLRLSRRYTRFIELHTVMSFLGIPADVDVDVGYYLTRSNRNGDPRESS